MKDHIQEAARLTFINVIFLSFFCCVVDAIRRRYMVDRSVSKIVRTAEKIMEGDLTFTVRLRRERDGTVPPHLRFELCGHLA
jgi:nitrogen fixation/metabolism regulation signal transduction histidine kinase